MSASDGGDPPNKPLGTPSTLAGVPAARPGLPPPQRQSHPPTNHPAGAPPPHAQPQAGYPAQPPAGYPAQPQAGYPAQPQAGYPAQPQAGYPAQPQAGYPAQPQAGYPAQPQAGYPAQPQAGYPAQPQAAQPQAGYPAPPQPGFTPAPPPLAEPAVFDQPLPSPVPEAQAVKVGKIGTESSPIQQIAGVIEEVPGKFVGFLKISSKRAFRLRIEPTEVLPDERQALAAANPPVVEENLQAFLAWRRSVLFLVATMLVPLSVIGMIDGLSGTKVAPAIRWVKLLPAGAETLFCLICWWQLKNWPNWRSQRKWLFIGWLLFMLTPFVVFIYPLREAFVGLGRSMSVQQIQELGWHGLYNKAVAPFAFSMIAMLQLAPKVISLMPGLIRSSLVIKLLFPGSAAPGWLIVMSAPLYALIAYALLIIPYQFTGEPWFIVGILLIVFGQALVARSGFALAKPLTQEEALRHIKRVRMFYMVVMLLALASIIGGLGLMVKLLNMKWASVITTVLKFESNVLILTMIGADLVVTNLDRARGYTEGREHVEEQTEQKIAAFVGLNAPPTPPPPGPAQ